MRQGLKPKTIRNYYVFVSAVLVNAGINVRPPRLPQKERPEIYIPDEATVRKLLQIVEGTELEIPVMLAAFGPLRRGEICALSMDDIKDGVCHVHHDLAQNADGEWVMKAPKTYSSDRYIELPDFVADAIKRNGSITDLTPDQISWKFADVLEQNGLPHFRFHSLKHPYVKHTTKIFSLRLMDFQAQAYPDARRKTRGACQLLRVGQSRSPVRPLCNRKRFSCLPPQSKMSWILYAISMRLSGYTSTRSISSSASSVVSVSASKIALDASLRLSCRVCSSCFCFACANTAA